MFSRTRVSGAISIVIVVIGILFGSASNVAASNHGQWFEGSNGCVYQWNEIIHDYHVSACSRADGGVDFWKNINGQWRWTVSAIQNNDGSTWLYAAGSGGWVLYPAASSTSVGGADGLSQNVLVNQILVDGIYNNNQIILNGGIRNCNYTYDC